MKIKHRKCALWPPSHTKNISLEISNNRYKKCLIYILIVILFFAHMNVHVAAIFFFSFKFTRQYRLVLVHLVATIESQLKYI